jgi:hypothetical protein
MTGKDVLHDTTVLTHSAFSYCDANQLPKPFVDFATRAKVFSPEKAARLCCRSRPRCMTACSS